MAAIRPGEAVGCCWLGNAEGAYSRTLQRPEFDRSFTVPHVQHEIASISLIVTWRVQIDPALQYGRGTRLWAWHVHAGK